MTPAGISPRPPLRVSSQVRDRYDRHVGQDADHRVNTIGTRRTISIFVVAG